MSIHIAAILSIYINIFGYILFLLLVLPNNQHFKIPLFVLTSISLVLYFFTLIGLGSIGVKFVQLVNWLLIFFTLILIISGIKKEIDFHRSNEKRKHIAKSFIIFSFLFLFLGLLSKFWFYNSWDEYAFWDAFVRSYYRFGEKLPDLIHSSYPPGLSLIQYYFVTSSIYNDNIICFATAFSIIAAIFSICPKFQKDKLYKYFSHFILIIFVFYIYGFELDLIMIDGFMGVMFGVLLTQIWSGNIWDKFGKIGFSINLAFFVLLKDSCIIFTFIIFVLLVYTTYSGLSLSNIQIKKNRLLLKTIKRIVPFGVVTGFTLISWQIRNLVVKPIPLNLIDGYSLERFIDLFSSSAYNQTSVQVNYFIQHLFIDKYEYTFFSVFVLSVFILSIVTIPSIIRGNNRDFNINFFVFLGFLFYVLITFSTLLFNWEDLTGIVSQSLFRYLGSYLLGWSMLVLRVILPLNSDKLILRKVLKIYFVTISFLIVIIAPYQKIFNYPLPQNPTWRNMINIYDDIKNEIPENSKILPLLGTYLEPQMLKNLFTGEAIVDVPLDLSPDITYLNNYDYIIIRVNDKTEKIGYELHFEDLNSEQNTIHLYKKGDKGKFYKNQ